MTKYLVPSAILLLACTLQSPAPVGGVNVTIDGNIYRVTDQPTTFNASSSLLESQVWYGNGPLAQQFATAVGVSLGKPNQSTYSPLFDYAGDGITGLMTYASSGGAGAALNYDASNLGTTFSFAVATYQGPALAPVPEASASPSLLVAAGLFVVWRGWRTVRPVSA